METIDGYTNERRRALLRFVTIVKGRKIASIREAKNDLPATFYIGELLSTESLFFLIEQLEERLGG